MSDRMSDERLTEIRSIDAGCVCTCDTCAARVDCVREIYALRAELAAARDAKPVAWIDRRNSGTRFRWHESDVAIFDLNPSIAEVMGVKDGECRPVYLGASIVAKPPLPEPVFRNDVLTVYEANGRTAEVRLGSSGVWLAISVPRNGEFDVANSDRDEADRLAAAYVAGATP